MKGFAGSLGVTDIQSQLEGVATNSVHVHVGLCARDEHNADGT